MNETAANLDALCPKCGKPMILWREGAYSATHSIDGSDCIRAQLSTVREERDRLRAAMIETRDMLKRRTDDFAGRSEDPATLQVVATAVLASAAICLHEALSR